MAVHIAPSILNADFSRLGAQVAEVEAAGAQRLHLDVMDGHFVPNLSMGPVVAQSLRPHTRLPIEVHLMVAEPGKFTAPFFRAGADSVIFHLEVRPDPRQLIEEVRAQGKKVGLAINPDKPVDELIPFLPLIDVALCMTVFPGFGGQPFLPQSPERIRRLRALIDQHNRACELEVDGGVDSKTAAVAAEAGASVLVIGTAIFRHPRGATAAVQELRNMVGNP